MMNQLEKIVFERDGLKSEGWILWRHTYDNMMFLVESPGGITWVHSREIEIKARIEAGNNG